MDERLCAKCNIITTAGIYLSESVLGVLEPTGRSHCCYCSRRPTIRPSLGFVFLMQIECHCGNMTIYATLSFPSLFHSQDYGSLVCWGSNELGKQVEPCIFNILPAGNEPKSF